MSPAGRILGIDYGSRRVGLAISDPLQMIAQGAGTTENTPDLADRIATLALEQSVVAVVVGMPYGPDGEIGPKAREVESFIAALRAVLRVPVDTWDESYTSVEAARLLVAGGMKQKERREKGRVDEMAARLLLQEFLDSRNPR
jgi:putative holliday junction resolvase